MAVEKFPESLEKTEDERKLVGWIMENVGKVAEFYGVDPYPYKPEYFHIFTNKAWDHFQEETKSTVSMVTLRTGIYTGESQFRNNGTLVNAIVIAHECFHLNSFNKIKYQEEADCFNTVTTHRSGIRIAHGPKETALRYCRFGGLNEGITQTLAMLFYGRVIRNSDKFKNLVAEFDRQHKAEDNDLFLYPEEIMNFYGQLVVLFEDLCEKILKLEPEKFINIDDVRDQFFKIYFSGRITDLKPLLDIVGPGSFGDLADIGSSDDLDDLQKIKKFREKFNLNEDSVLNELIKEKEIDGKK